MFVAERFLSGIVKIHGNHPVSTDVYTSLRVSQTESSYSSFLAKK